MSRASDDDDPGGPVAPPWTDDPSEPGDAFRAAFGGHRDRDRDRDRGTVAAEEFPGRLETPARVPTESPRALSIERAMTSPAAESPGAPRPYLCVNASLVAVCMNANRHKKVDEAVVALWRRVAPRSYYEALERNDMKTDDRLVVEVMARHEAVKDLVTQSLVLPCESSAQVASNYDAVAERLAGVSLDDDDHRRIDDVLKRNLYTAYGNAKEHETLAYVRDSLGIDCRPDDAFYRKKFGSVDGVDWYVGGRVDAVTPARDLVVEIKNRVNRLFFNVPFYEFVQVQAYLELLDVDRGALVERLKHDGARSSVNVVPIARDRAMWNDVVVPKVHGFVSFVVKLLRDPALQDKFLRSPRPGALVLAHARAAAAAVIIGRGRTG